MWVHNESHSLYHSAFMRKLHVTWIPLENRAEKSFRKTIQILQLTNIVQHIGQHVKHCTLTFCFISYEEKPKKHRETRETSVKLTFSGSKLGIFRPVATIRSPVTLHLKIGAWNTIFLLGWPVFRAYSFGKCKF